MCKPFKIGDTVYHAEYGEGVVSNFDKTSTPVLAKYTDGMAYWASVGVLSFKPWPAPCHERPFEPVLKKGDKVLAIKKNSSCDVFITVKEEWPDCIFSYTGMTYSKSEYDFYPLATPIKFD